MSKWSNVFSSRFGQVQYWIGIPLFFHDVLLKLIGRRLKGLGAWFFEPSKFVRDNLPRTVCNVFTFSKQFRLFQSHWWLMLIPERVIPDKFIRSISYYRGICKREQFWAKNFYIFPVWCKNILTTKSITKKIWFFGEHIFYRWQSRSN